MNTRGSCRPPAAGTFSSCFLVRCRVGFPRSVLLFFPEGVGGWRTVVVGRPSRELRPSAWVGGWGMWVSSPGRSKGACLCPCHTATLARCFPVDPSL